MRGIINDICYLLLCTKIGNKILSFLCDIAWIYGYLRGKIRRIFRRIVK